MNIVAYERENFFSRLIWLFPVAFLFHIIEESHGFTDWVTNVLQGQMDVRIFYVNNAAFMAVLLTLCFIANRQQAVWSTFLLFFWVSAQEFWNFMFHIYTQVQFNAYSPGYFTAILLYLPTYFYLSYLCLRERFLSAKLWLCCFVFSPIGMGFTIWAGLYHFGSVPWDKWL